MRQSFPSLAEAGSLSSLLSPATTDSAFRSQAVDTSTRPILHEIRRNVCVWYFVRNSTRSCLRYKQSASDIVEERYRAPSVLVRDTAVVGIDNIFISNEDRSALRGCNRGNQKEQQRGIHDTMRNDRIFLKFSLCLYK